jgi:hypothetical protein
MEQSQPHGAATGSPEGRRQPTRLAVSATLHCLTGCAIGAALGVALAVTVPVNRALIARGTGHAVVHRYH